MWIINLIKYYDINNILLSFVWIVNFLNNMQIIIFCLTLYELLIILMIKWIINFIKFYIIY